MSAVVPGLLSMAFGGVLFLLGRWGMSNGEALVPGQVAAARREKEIRSIQRGSRSCVVLGGLFVLMGGSLLVTGALA